LRSVNLETFGDNFLISYDFNLCLDNLGLDVLGLEERGLFGIKTGGASSDPDIIWSDNSNLGWSFSLLGINDFLDFAEIAITKYEPCITFQ